MGSSASENMFAELYAQIARGDLYPGTLLPSEKELATRYGISRPTVRRVLERLRDQNLIETRSGVGTFVRDPGRKVPQKEIRIGVDFFGGSLYYGKIIEGVTSSSGGGNCFFSVLSREEIRAGRIPDSLDALLLTSESSPEAMRSVLASGKPTVTINHCWESEQIACLTVNHRREAEQAVTYLIQSGFRSIALVGACPAGASPNLYQRSLGYLDAFRALGLPVPEDLALSVQVIRSERTDLLEAFVREKQFDAFFSTSGTIFQHFATACDRWRPGGLDALEVISFDEIEALEAFRNRRCSYVRMPLRRFGEMAVAYLREKLADPTHEVLRCTLECDLVIRSKK